MLINLIILELFHIKIFWLFILHYNIYINDNRKLISGKA